MPVILAPQEAEIRRITVCGQHRHIVHQSPSQKYPTQRTAGRNAQVIECLSSKHETQSSNASSLKKKKEIKKEFHP
jgi:hypothetical protein